MKKKVNIALVVLYLILCTSIFFTVISRANDTNINHKVFETKSYDVDVNGTESHIKVNLDKDDSNKYLFFKTRDSFVEVKMGDTTIYNFARGNTVIESPGTSWHVIGLTSNVEGKVLDVKLSSTSLLKQADRLDLYIEEGVDVTRRIIGIELIDIIFTIVLLCISVVLLIVVLINAIYRKPLNDIISLLCLCFAIFFVTVWTSSELYTTQMLIGSPTIRYFMYYVSFQCIPLAVSCYLMTKEKVPDFEINITYILFLIILNILHVTGVVQLHNMSYIFIFVAMLYMIKALINYINDYNTKSVKLIVVSVISLLVCLTINIVQFISKPNGNYSLIPAKIGFIIFLLFISISNILDQLRREKSVEQYKAAAKYARTDYLTGLKNRLALAQDFETIDKDDIAILSIDLNNLKYYNDVYGHKMGDALLKSASNVLVKIFGHERVYRIGGDEFVGICPVHNDIDEIRKLISRECLKEESSIRDEIILEIAVGGCFDVNEETLDTALHEADEDMYVDKKNIKKHSRLNKGNYVDSRLK